MEFIEKHKALIITSMLMGIVVLSLYNINMIHKQKEQSEILMEIPEEFLAKEEEPEEELIAQEDRQLIASKRTHSAYNEDFEDHDEFEQRMKSLTETETASEESEETTTTEESEVSINDEQNENEKKEKSEPEGKETNNRNSSLTYSLKNRKSIDLPNPVYTCNGSGKVVVKIEVNKNGYVVNTKIDKKNSTTRNECLFDNAMDYARKALFSRSDIEEQKGSITYYFNYGY
jgi:outer membrane biosynthesis protein TonB